MAYGDWSSLGYTWRTVRFDDLEGCVIGLRLDKVVNETGWGKLGKTGFVDMIAVGGNHDGAWLRWTERSMPPWIWDELLESDKSFIVGKVVNGRLRHGLTIDESTRLNAHGKAISRGEVSRGGGKPMPDMVLRPAEGGGVEIGDSAPGETRAGVAKAYANRDWMIFPLAPGSKATHRGSRGYRDAHGGEKWAEALAAYFAAWPADNIGLACGIGGSPVVIDIDPKNGGSIEKAIEYFSKYAEPDSPGSITVRSIKGGSVSNLREAFESTGRVSTPSGGMHLYFYDEELPAHRGDGIRVAPSVDSGRFPGLDGVEFKASGKHVVMPPSSLRGGGEYRWVTPSRSSERSMGICEPLPEAVRDACFEARARKSEVIPGMGDYDFWVDPELLIAAVSGAGKGERNNVLHTATREAARCLAGTDRASCLTELAKAGVASGLGESEVRRTMRSALEYVLGPGYVL